MLKERLGIPRGFLCAMNSFATSHFITMVRSFKEVCQSGSLMVGHETTMFPVQDTKSDMHHKTHLVSQPMKYKHSTTPNHPISPPRFPQWALLPLLILQTPLFLLKLQLRNLPPPPLIILPRMLDLIH